MFTALALTITLTHGSLLADTHVSMRHARFIETPSSVTRGLTQGASEPSREDDLKLRSFGYASVAGPIALIAVGGVTSITAVILIVTGALVPVAGIALAAIGALISGISTVPLVTQLVINARASRQLRASVSAPEPLVTLARF